MFFMQEDAKTLQAGWYSEKTGKHTHEPKTEAQAQGVDHREADVSVTPSAGNNGIQALWPALVDFALSVQANPARIIEELTGMAGGNPLKISLLIKFPIARST